jgi:hypothetical protein
MCKRVVASLDVLKASSASGKMEEPEPHSQLRHAAREDARKSQMARMNKS